MGYYTVDNFDLGNEPMNLINRIPKYQIFYETRDQNIRCKLPILHCMYENH